MADPAAPIKFESTRLPGPLAYRVSPFSRLVVPTGVNAASVLEFNMKSSVPAPPVNVRSTLAETSVAVSVSLPSAVLTTKLSKSAVGMVSTVFPMLNVPGTPEAKLMKVEAPPFEVTTVSVPTSWTVN